jgi:hypothetical protein
MALNTLNAETWMEARFILREIRNELGHCGAEFALLFRG